MPAQKRLGFIALMAVALGCAPVVVEFAPDGQVVGLRSAPAAAQGKKTKSGSLAGSEGDIKRKIMFTPYFEGGCKGLYQSYIRAAGHSAYAGTAFDYEGDSSMVCSTGLNEGSQAAAEQRAMAECANAVRRFKAQNQSMRLLGKCMIYASK
jgi:hypothetical protein